MDKIIVIGGKGTAVVLAEQIYDAQVKNSDVEFLGFAFDDEAFGKEINGFPILCKTYDAYEKYKAYSDVKFIFQMYRTDIQTERINLRESYGIPLDRYATFVHPSAYVARSVKIGRGCALLANAAVNSNVVIGNHVTINCGSLIGHDTKLGDNNFIAAHTVIGSNTVIGSGNFFGLNTSVNNKIIIGSDNFIGMASNVIKSIGDRKKVYGNPAHEASGPIKPL